MNTKSTREAIPHRSTDQTRFAPCETTKKAVRCDWLDTDNIARIELEHRLWEPLHPTATDEHGYPAA